MIESLIHLLLTSALILVATYAPGFIALRILGGSRLLSLALAPALGATTAGITAIAAPAVGIAWSLVPYLAGSGFLIAAALMLALCGIRLPSTILDSPPVPQGLGRHKAWWYGTLAAATMAAVGPIFAAAGRPDAVLERYDTLFHLTALQHIRTSGNGSSLTLNSVANASGSATAYPAAFHDLAALIPGIDIPIVLNGSTLALAFVPWVLGIAILVRVIYPDIPWAPPVAALGAVIIPATPLNLWIHLSPVPNLVGFAMLPGMLAAATALWASLVTDRGAHDRSTSDATAISRTHDTRRRTLGGALASAAALGAAGIGLTLLQPNVAVTALLLLTVLTVATGARHWKTKPLLAAIPILFVAPIALLMLTPLGARVTGFSGGLHVPLWQALGEVSLGLLTVWPMALGVIIAALWWPGLVRTLRRGTQWVAVAWIVFALMYLDAAVDSPLGLSVLYFRGQDRIAIPLAMLSIVLTIPGIQAWVDAFYNGKQEPRRVPDAQGFIAILTIVVVIATLASIPRRFDNASLNLAAEYPGRGRFIQPGEREAFAKVAPHLDPHRAVLASPYSGAAHMDALYGIPAHFPVAGVALSDSDREAMKAVALAGHSPSDCQKLHDLNIGYVYQERWLYQYDPAFAPISQGGDDLGRVLFSTNHSRLIEVGCSASN